MCIAHCPPEFLNLDDEFIHLANRLAKGGNDREVSAAILFAAGRYNAFNFMSKNSVKGPGQRGGVLRVRVP